MQHFSRRQFLKGLGLGLGAAALVAATGDKLPGAAGELLGPSASAAPTLDKTKRVHPFLQYGAQAEPSKLVRVIVSKKSSKYTSAGIASAVGGKVLTDFPAINSFTMQVTQATTIKLGVVGGVRYVTPDLAMRTTAIDVSTLKTTYEGAIGAPQVWNSASLPATGKGVTIAVLDTGVNSSHPDLGSNLITVSANKRALGTQDGHGHGTHVIGIIKGRDPQGRYLGVAPDAQVISVKVADDTGAATDSDMVAGLQWVYSNRAAYNITVAVISFSASTAVTYTTSAIAAYCEQLWQAGVTVVVSVGNKGSAPDATWYAPGNDPWLISVGALDNSETVARTDDLLASWSGRGNTQDVTLAGAPIFKPEILAPGRRIVAPLASANCTIATSYPDRVTDSRYIRLSGTSMSAPIIGGVVALLLERFPSLTPNQIKWLLMNTERAYPAQADGAGVVDPVALLARAAQGNIGTANAGLAQSSAVDPLTGTVATGYWDQGYWDQGYWDQGYWDQCGKLD
jgi:serine protease AprX